ncbi:MAG: PAS domain S-box protein [Myxococcales bacterium]|nr:PAS domain S-box protein [Myxococcales bacterium]
MEASRGTSPDRGWFDEALRAGSVGAWSWHIASGRVDWSSNVAELLGLDPGEFEHTFEHYLSLVHDEDRVGFQAALAAATADGGPAGYLNRHRIRGRGGGFAWIEAEGKVRRSAEGVAEVICGTVRNVTAVVALEIERDRREAHGRAFAAALPGIGFILDEHGVYRRIFAHDEQLLAVDRGAALGRSVDEVLPADAAALVRSEIRAVLDTDLPRAVEYELPLPSGLASFEARVAPIEGGWEGDPAVVWIANEITERRRAENALRESEARYRTVVQLMAKGIVVVGKTGHVLASNPAAQRILRLDQRTLDGHDAWDPRWRLFDQHDEPISPDRLPVMRSLLHGEVCEHELIGIQDVGDPEPRWLLVSSRPIERWSGAPVDAALASFIDVSEQRRAESALRHSEAQLRLVTENADVMLWHLDADGRVLFLGGKVVEKLGFDPPAMLGQNALELTPNEESTEDIRRALAGETFRVQRQLGAHVFDVSYTPVRGPRGRLAGSIGVAVEVTERVRALRERERLVGELEAKNAELERFNYTVSHDLKSPLITIRGFADLLARDLDKRDLSRMPRDLEHIVRATARMQQLLDDLLTLSRAGRARELEQLSVREIVEEALAQVRAAVQRRGVTVTVSPHLPTVFADRTGMLQLFQNLIDNAVKHVGAREDPRVEIGVREDGAVYVRDNGDGIPSRYHEKIFELFERLDPDVPGTGVGLALARQVVESHGGRLWVESTGTPGEGCSFCVALPPLPPPGDDAAR